MKLSHRFTRTLKPVLAVAFIFGITTTAQAAILAVDLTTSNSGTINGPLPVKFDYYKINTAGTGVIDPFLRIQGNGTEQGYNTTVANAGQLPFDDKFGAFTHDLSFSSLTADSSGNYNFLLDIGEPVGNSQSLLSLDGLKLYRTSTPGQNNTSVDANGNVNGIVGTVLWNLDALVNNYILLDSNRNGNPGNGFSDMLMSVPTSVFAGVGSSDYIVLWSRFGLQAGAQSGSGSDGTFEEWSHLRGNGNVVPCNPAVQQCGPSQIPEPTSLLLMSAGLIGFSLARRRKSV